MKSTLPTHSVLVIGYGNELRGDDAIGPRIINAIEDWQVPTVQTKILHQLTPELAEELARSEWVIFVDACQFNGPHNVQVRPLEAIGCETSGSSVPALGHTCDPQSLLALAQSTYGHRPHAWSIEVPAEDFSMGEHLSATAEEGIAEALEIIQTLIPTQKMADLSTPEEPICMK